jgi:hypothetical protein
VAAHPLQQDLYFGGLVAAIHEQLPADFVARLHIPDKPVALEADRSDARGGEQLPG